MENKRLFAMTAVGLAAAIAVPTIAFGNARSNTGSLHAVQLAQTPLVTRMTGAAELTATTPTGDSDGIGAAAVTFDLIATPPTVCWDLSYSGVVTPLTAAHIHQGAVGVAGPAVITFTPASLGASSATGCADLTAPEILAAPDIVANPASYYVNIHNADFVAPSGAIRGQLAAGPAPAGEAHMLPVPLRAYDSRDAAGAKILQGETRTISLASGHTLGSTVQTIAVPPGATAALVTLTVTETAVGVGGNGGFLTMYNASIPQPATSSINWAGADQNIAVSTQVAVDASGQVKVSAGANATHFVIDVIGYTF
jgi:hypothetical protein